MIGGYLYFILTPDWLSNMCADPSLAEQARHQGGGQDHDQRERRPHHRATGNEFSYNTCLKRTIIVKKLNINIQHLFVYNMIIFEFLNFDYSS